MDSRRSRTIINLTQYQGGSVMITEVGEYKMVRTLAKKPYCNSDTPFVVQINTKPGSKDKYSRNANYDICVPLHSVKVQVVGFGAVKEEFMAIEVYDCFINPERHAELDQDKKGNLFAYILRSAGTFKCVVAYESDEARITLGNAQILWKKLIATIPQTIPTDDVVFSDSKNDTKFCRKYKPIQHFCGQWVLQKDSVINALAPLDDRKRVPKQEGKPGVNEVAVEGTETVSDAYITVAGITVPITGEVASGSKVIAVKCYYGVEIPIAHLIGFTSFEAMQSEQERNEREVTSVVIVPLYEMNSEGQVVTDFRNIPTFPLYS